MYTYNFKRRIYSFLNIINFFDLFLKHYSFLDDHSVGFRCVEAYCGDGFMDVYLAPKRIKLYTLTVYRFLYISHTSWKNKQVPNWERSMSGCILSPCLFNLYAEYIMWNARLDEAQAEIKIAGRNINKLNYTDDNTWMEESEEELKSSLMRVKVDSEKAGLKLNI